MKCKRCRQRKLPPKLFIFFFIYRNLGGEPTLPTPFVLYLFLFPKIINDNNNIIIIIIKINNI
jgi:hypothetical protein